MLVLRRFLARATSASVTLVQSDILEGQKEAKVSEQSCMCLSSTVCVCECDLISPFFLSEAHHVIDGAGLTHHVESPQACVGIAGVEGLEAVAQVPLTRHLSQLA